MPNFDLIRKVNVEYGEMTSTGKLEIIFSDVVGVPGNVTEWSDSNEGAKYLDILYLPNQKSEILFEELDINMEFSWNIDSIVEV